MQAALRHWFAQWGLPDQLRVDNGPPWGSWGDLPPELALWVLGLGVSVHWNRPRHSRDNAVIERAHGVCQAWVEPATCPDAATLQARLEWATTTQREHYPSRAGPSRLAAAPALAHSGRSYDPTQEAAQWDVHRVWAALAEGRWPRQVDKVGRISLYNRAIRVGRPWAGRTVSVQLAVRAGQPHWHIRAADGSALAMAPAPELTREPIVTLEVLHRRHPTPHGGKPRAPPGAQPYSR